MTLPKRQTWGDVIVQAPSVRNWVDILRKIGEELGKLQGTLEQLGLSIVVNDFSCCGGSALPHNLKSEKSYLPCTTGFKEPS